MTIALKFALLILLLVLSAFFSGSETAYFSLSRFDIQWMRVRKLRGSGGVGSLLKRPGTLLIAILVGNMIVNVSATTLMTGTFMEVMGRGAVPVAVLVMTVLVLIFGEITPKVIAVEHNRLWARLGSLPLGIALVITTPVRLVLQGIQYLVLGREHGGDLRLGEVDIESALELAHREGAVGGQARDLLLHFLAVDRVVAADIMVPWARVPILDPSITIEEAREFFLDQANRFALIFFADTDKPAILKRERVLLSKNREELADLAEEPLFVPSMRVLAGLFDDVRERNRDYLVVIDEHGGIAGVIGRDRVLSAIFGEPTRKTGIDLSELSRIGESYLLPATVTLSQFNNAFDAGLVSEHYNSLGGYLISAFGDIPSPGDSLERDGFLFRVIRADRRKVERVAVKRVV